MSEPSRHRVASRGEIPEGGRKIVKIQRGKSEIEIGVFHIGGKYRAYRNVCPHAGAPVCEGRITGTTLPSAVYEYEYSAERCVVRCPWHGWEFDLETGRHLVDERMKLRSFEIAADAPDGDGAASDDLETFAVETEAEGVYVTL